MVRSTLLPTLFLTCSILSGQVNYLDYHARVNEAENLLTQENFIESIGIYDSLFNAFDFIFVKDYIVASQLALVEGKFDKVDHWLEKAVAQGYKCACIERIPIFSEYIQSQSWKEIRSREQEMRMQYMQAIDSELHYDFHRRYSNEQELKGSNNYEAVVNRNFEQIRSLLKSRSFLGERLVGIDDHAIANPKSGGRLNSCDASNSKVVVTLLHYAGPMTEIGIPNFVMSISSGHLHPREFATIYTFEYNEVSSLYSSRKYSEVGLPEYNFNFPFGSKPDNLSLVNATREQFGICTVEVDQGKDRIEKAYGMRLRFGY